MAPKRRAAAVPVASEPNATSTRQTRTAPAATRSTRGKRADSPAPEEAQQEEAPAKKKPGRPAKIAKNDALTDDAPVEAPKKRGRAASKNSPAEPEAAAVAAPSVKGRGRKAKVAEKESGESAPAPKKRGRQAMTVVEEPITTADEPSTANPTGKRGRTAAKQITEELQDAIKEAESSKTTARGRGRGKASTKPDAVKHSVAEPEQKPRRGRVAVKKAESGEPRKTTGRGRKAKATEAEEEEEVVVPAPKKAVGRGRKAKVVEAEEEAVEPQPEKKARGRPKKTVTIVEPEAEVDEPEPLAPRGRGRKTVATSDGEEITPAPKRGRPAKPAAKSEPTETRPSKAGRGRPAKKVEEGKAIAKAAKTGRGRPQKAEPKLDQDQELMEEVEQAVDDLREPEESEPAPVARELATPSGVKGRRKTVGGEVTPKSSEVDTGAAMSAPPKARGRPPKRSLPAEPPAEDAQAEQTPPKRAKRTSASDLPAASERPSRRQTMAIKPSTPQIGKAALQMPGTAPPKAGPGRPRKSDTAAAPPVAITASSSATPKSLMATAEEKTAAADALGKQGAKPARRQTIAPKPSTPAASKSHTTVPETAPAKQRGRPRKSVDAATPQVEQATPKPPKTVQPKKAEKAAAGKRKRVSSPGPAARKKRASSPAVVPAPKRKSLANEDIPAAASGISYWLLKAEPTPPGKDRNDVTFSIDDLAAKQEPEFWDGVRNAIANKNLKAMRKGDLAFFYHSNAGKQTGIVGIMEVAEDPKPDPSAFDKDAYYYDARSTLSKPTWFCPGVVFRSKFEHPERVTLDALRKHSEAGCALQDMQLFTTFRLSVTKVSPAEFDFIMGLAGEKVPESLHVHEQTAGNGVQDEIVAEAAAGAQKEDLQEATQSAVELIGDAIGEVVNDLVEAAVEAVGEDVADEVAPAVAAALGTEADKLAEEEIHEQIAEQVEEAVQADVKEAVEQAVVDTVAGAAVTSDALEPKSDAAAPLSSIEFPHVQAAISEDMSELPDAPADTSFSYIGDEAKDRLTDLPPTYTAGRASSPRRAGSLSPRKVVKVPSRHSSRAPSLGPDVGSKPASRAASRAPTLGPAPSLASAPVAKGRTSRRSSRAPSLGPSAAVQPSSPLPSVLQEKTTPVIEEVSWQQQEQVSAAASVGATFAVPDEEEGDTSLFGEREMGTSPTQALYPDLSNGDHTFSF